MASRTPRGLVAPLPGTPSLTITDALVPAGCGTLCPMMHGMALGLFDRNLGLTGELVSAVCHLAVAPPPRLETTAS